ncbi:hypothetical protein NDU88_004281 [Pleurodeles waltl]|uniref:Uncharacterized protein n=1 Tax=Pleurodeles waltl TaxID=8319 RepID=A0AAV7RGD7_PLEWA|nr:hypothetical protein NDU88_004281 [Pleurodeles waltl]
MSAGLAPCSSPLVPEECYCTHESHLQRSGCTLERTPVGPATRPQTRRQRALHLTVWRQFAVLQAAANGKAPR